MNAKNESTVGAPYTMEKGSIYLEETDSVFKVHTITLKGSLNENLNTLTVDDTVYRYNQFFDRVYERIEVQPKEKARELITKIKRRVNLLPNTVADITTYLRKEQLALLEKLDQYQRIEDILYTIEPNDSVNIRLATWTLNQLWLYNEWSNWVLYTIQTIHDQKKSKPNSPNLSVVDHFWKQVKPILEQCTETLSLLLTVRWIRRQIWICENVGIDKQDSTPRKKKAKRAVTQRELALYYFYLHDKECIPSFNQLPIKKEEAYKEVTKPYRLSWKHFQAKYNRYVSSPTERRAIDNIDALKNVYHMLAGYDEAQKFAHDELMIALSKQG